MKSRMLQAMLLWATLQPGLVAAQTTPGGPPVAPPASPGRAAPTAAPVPAGPPSATSDNPGAAVDADYKLGVADRVRVNVYNEPDLSGDFAVSANGTLSLPLIGDMAVVGDTASQVVVKVQRRLADGYLKDPHVSLEVLTYRPFYIMGEVNKPGEYPYSNGLTVLNAVAAAGGFTYRANKSKVYIRHSGSDKDDAARIAPGLQIQPGDTIRIGERYF